MILEAARGGDHRAERYLAELLESGTGMDLDLQQAEQWYQKAALGGDPEALYRIGTAAFSGQEISGRRTAPDVNRARQLIRMAAEKGSARAKLHALAKTVTEPTAPPKVSKPVAESPALPPVKIQASLLAAAKKGNAQAQFRVGMAYFDAHQYQAAKEWLEKAAAQKHPIAKDILKHVDSKLNQPK